ncbi:YccF domain-containing protein [Atopococcus tabaci]|uniref:YccF domain-containing protein n=1 Tax=Atopococcus tabaci TaxID=269774 RepID=UPI00240A3AB2|nr:YccF domain-containing protein [Atopococcus tabaci]
MRTAGNVLWFVLGGFVSWLTWGALGVLWCLTIIGIPIGRLCFNFAKMSAAPFGKDIQFDDSGFSLLLNVVWLVLGGFVVVLEELTLGAIFCLTIVGIPFGLQHFKHAKLALLPFGATIYRV